MTQAVAEPEAQQAVDSPIKDTLLARLDDLLEQYLPHARPVPKRLKRRYRRV